MARIANYSKDTIITGGDKVIGTNQANGDTVNFLVEDLANYISSVADIDVSVANLKIRLPQIDSNVTIGNGSDVDTTISGDLNVNGDLTVNGEISALSVENSLSVVFSVKNTSGELLPKGTVVHVASTQSSQGNIIDVVKADNSSSAGMPAIGILNVQLADDGEGEAVVIGRVNQIDTSAFASGDELYVNTNGDFTNVKPTGTALIQKIAVVIKSHASNGSIEVFGAGRSNDLPNITLNNIWLGNASGVPTPTAHTVENITDVNITNLQDNQILKYNSSTSQWENEADSVGAIDGTGAANKIAIWSDADTLTNDTNLHWDTANDRLGIGTTSPSDILDIRSDSVLSIKLGNSLGVNGYKLKSNVSSTNDFGFVIEDFSGTDLYNVKAGSGGFHRFLIDGSEKMRITSSGNVGIGTTSPSYKLSTKTTGTTSEAVAGFGNNNIEGGLQIITSDGNLEWGLNTLNSRSLVFQTNQTERLRIDSSGNVGIGTTSPSGKLHLSEDGGSGGVISIIENTDASFSSSYAGLTLKTGLNTAEIQAVSGAGGAGYLSFINESSERMRIDSSGRVGINQSSPTAGLHVVNSNSIGESIAVLEAQAAKNGYVYINADDNRRKSLVFQSGGVNKFSMGVGDSDELPESSFFIGAGIGGGNNADLVINSSGNVGIGTDSPSAKLDVSFAGGSDSIKSSSTSSTSYNSSKFYNDNSKGWHDLVYGSAYSSGSLLNIGANGATTYANTIAGITTVGAFDLLLGTNSTERMRIDSSGNVGIGTTSPSAKLHTVGEIVGANATGFTSGMIGFTGLGSYNSSTAVENIDALYLRKGGSDGSSTSIALASASGDNYFVGSRIKFIRTGSNSKGHLAFETKPDTSTNTTVERMRIEDGGNVGIGTDSPNELLHLNVGDSGTNYLQFTNLTTGTGSTDGMLVGLGNGEEATIWQFENDHMRFGTNNSERMRIDSQGRVGIGTSSPAAGAVLDISATNRGVLLPRLTTTQINTIQFPENGLMVYNTTLNTICFYNGSSWQKVSTTNM